MNKKMNTLRGWIPTTGLALVLAFGATVANAGEITNRSSNDGQPCKNGILVSDSPIAGILVSDGPVAAVVQAIAGILVSDGPTSTCGTGILVSD